MALLVGADGAAKLNLGSGLKYVANIFSWQAQLRRETLRRTTQADDFERRTAGLGDWSGSFSFRMQFSDDTSVALSSWQLLNYALTATDDDLKAEVELILQHYTLPADNDVFATTIPGVIKLTGTVVIADISMNCEDPEQPIIAVASWEGDGALTPEREDGEGGAPG
jgi:hypothetical protein